MTFGLNTLGTSGTAVLSSEAIGYELKSQGTFVLNAQANFILNMGELLCLRPPNGVWVRMALISSIYNIVGCFVEHGAASGTPTITSHIVKYRVLKPSTISATGYGIQMYTKDGLPGFNIDSSPLLVDTIIQNAVPGTFAMPTPTFGERYVIVNGLDTWSYIDGVNYNGMMDYSLAFCINSEISLSLQDSRYYFDYDNYGGSARNLDNLLFAGYTV